MNKTLVTLIPKVECPKNVKQFRTISLCNVSYKIISKTLVNRLKPIMNDVVAPFQNAFIKGRLISDNIILEGELINIIKRKKIRKMHFGCSKN